MYPHSSRASQDQINALLDFMEKHPVMQVGPGKGIEHRFECKKLWQEAATICNAIKGAKKTTKGWIKFWADKKCNVRKASLSRRTSENHMSALDRRILDFAGGRREMRYKSMQIKRDPVDYDDDQSADETRESKPIEFVDHNMESEEDRHSALMDKLFQVMSEQAVAMTKLAEASQSQAASLARLADAVQLQAGAAERLADSAERAADSLGALSEHRAASSLLQR